MPEIDGIDVMSELSNREIKWPVIVITAHADIPVAVQAIRHGAIDLFEKPLEFDHLERSLDFGQMWTHWNKVLPKQRDHTFKPPIDLQQYNPAFETAKSAFELHACSKSWATSPRALQSIAVGFIFMIATVFSLTNPVAGAAGCACWPSLFETFSSASKPGLKGISVSISVSASAGHLLNL